MADGYEWVFLVCYASLGVAGLMILQGTYAIIRENRERRLGGRISPRTPGPHPRV